MYFAVNGELYHYGIKGMKWGVRRTPEQLGHKTSTSEKKTNIVSLIKKKKASKTSSSDSQTAKRKSTSEMSDEELRNTLNRLRMEKEYLELTSKKASTNKASLLSSTNKVMKDVSGILVSSATAVASVNRIQKQIDELMKETK